MGSVTDVFGRPRPLDAPGGAAQLLHLLQGKVPGDVMALLKHQLPLLEAGHAGRPEFGDLLRRLAGETRLTPSTNLSAELGALLASEAGSDVTLACGGARLRAHSAVLCARSPVFRAQIRGPMARPTGECVPVFESIQPDIMRRVLQFVYTDALEPATTGVEAQHLLNAADLYGLARLLAHCADVLTASLSIDNATHVLTLADQHSLAGLKAASLNFVAWHGAAVLATSGWARLASSRFSLASEAVLVMLR